MQPARKNLVLGILAVALFGAAAAIYFTRQPATARIPDTYRMLGVCLKCGSDVQAEYRSRDLPIGTCPTCGTQTVYSWMYCYDCRKRFVPNLVPGDAGRPPMPPVVPVCTACGSSHTGALVSEDPEQSPTGDAPLPKLP